MQTGTGTRASASFPFLFKRNKKTEGDDRPCCFQLRIYSFRADSSAVCCNSSEKCISGYFTNDWVSDLLAY